MTGADHPADAQWRRWRERRRPAQRIHLDSAAAGRSSLATLAATATPSPWCRPSGVRTCTRSPPGAFGEVGPRLLAGAVSRDRLSSRHLPATIRIANDSDYGLGGVKASGIGRELGRGAIGAYQQFKSIHT